MVKNNIIHILQLHLPYMKEKYGLQSIALFGSFSKGEAKGNSDIDLLVELDLPYAKNYFGLLVFLEKQFSQPVGLVRKGNHTDFNFLSSIKNDLIYAG